MIDGIPEPEQVIEELRDFVPLAYGALEAGAVERNRLKVEFELVDLANNGLLVWYRGYQLRIRKAYRGSVGVPGSFSMELFHAQTLRLFAEPARPNLFVLWDVYKPSYMLAPDLYVACPKKNTARFPNPADLHWLWKLPNVQLLPGAPIEAEGFDEYEDLPIRIPVEETRGGDVT